MDQVKQKLKQNIEDKDGNLWESRSRNPYRQHPLMLLELDKQTNVTAQMISASVQKLSGRQRAGVKSISATEAGTMTPSRARDLLMRPETRVICELMRIPPVEIPKEDLDELKQLAGEMFKEPVSLPWPDAIGCEWERVAEVILKFVSTQAEMLELPRVIQPEFGPPLELPRQNFTGVSFRARRKKEN